MIRVAVPLDHKGICFLFTPPCRRGNLAEPVINLEPVTAFQGPHTPDPFIHGDKQLDARVSARIPSTWVSEIKDIKSNATLGFRLQADG